jgi:hypothetical protein
MLKSNFTDIKQKLNFINISTEKLTLVEWKPPRSFKSYILDLNIVKENATEDIFFHIYKGNSKIAHIKKGDLIYTIGAKNDVQFQLMEALLEFIDEKFKEIYDLEVILSFENVSSNIFRNFNNNIEKILDNLKELDLVKNISVYCRVCKKVLQIYVKRSFIETAEDFPVPLVYNHSGHAVLIFIDRNFDVRGAELVQLTG